MKAGLRSASVRKRHGRPAWAGWFAVALALVLWLQGGVAARHGVAMALAAEGTGPAGFEICSAPGRGDASEPATRSDGPGHGHAREHCDGCCGGQLAAPPAALAVALASPRLAAAGAPSKPPRVTGVWLAPLSRGPPAIA